ncbi:uncharacterized protein BXZ73DRAFT_82384 [Epithele typhae]|uniref:uncharacterized protein n=1 Tax=Epithele typhae TaxID=378194 RepID=UPI00200734E8|nr:uncharacterized protein BXZ73DRAFT_82384 [Epithele typhae]KAH9912309.1 hypothetical protein BXZ73DRAFT_82384 [Epithele typhae]
MAGYPTQGSDGSLVLDIWISHVEEASRPRPQPTWKMECQIFRVSMHRHGWTWRWLASTRYGDSGSEGVYGCDEPTNAGMLKRDSDGRRESAPVHGTTTTTGPRSTAGSGAGTDVGADAAVSQYGGGGVSGGSWSCTAYGVEIGAGRGGPSSTLKANVGVIGGGDAEGKEGERHGELESGVWMDSEGEWVSGEGESFEPEWTDAAEHVDGYGVTLLEAITAMSRTRMLAPIPMKSCTCRDCIELAECELGNGELSGQADDGDSPPEGGSNGVDGAGGNGDWIYASHVTVAVDVTVTVVATATVTVTSR